MDGTIYLEDKMIDGAVDVLNYIMSNGKQLLFVTNKTTQTKEEYATFLNNNNVAISTNQILTAADNSVNYLQKERVGKKFYAIAEEPFISSITNAGLKFSENPNDIEIVIISLDRNYSKQKFEIAKQAINNGAEFLAANIDNTCPVIKGEIVDAGIIISELEQETGKRIIKQFGKPSEFMIQSLKNKLKFNLNEYLLIGDRLETDILMGNKMGIATVLVDSGVFTSPKNSHHSPTFSITSIKELLT